jgi:ADP-ribose pyrophosphatase YjhB (NUDIX family)
MLAPDIEAEVAALASRFGAPRRVDLALTGAPFDPLIKADRFGEVCMVLRRPNGRLLTASKTYYPPGVFRLLTGGVGHGEPIERALLREVDEETSLHVAVRRFLAVIEYRLDGDSGLRAGSLGPRANTTTPSPYHFVTFAFLLDEIGGVLEVRDPEERVAAFREVGVDELPLLADTLDRAGDEFDPEISGSWADWGRFRAVAHRLVYAALAQAL